MAMKETIIKKLQQATCDKTELNKKVVKWQKSLKEAEKALKDGGKKDSKNLEEIHYGNEVNKRQF